MRWQWQHEPEDHGVRFWLIQKGRLKRDKTLPVADWPSAADKSGIGLMHHWMNQSVGHVNETSVTVPHEVVAHLSEPQARAVDLPAPSPHAVSISAHGTLDRAEFDLSYKWLRNGTIEERLERFGALGRVGYDWYRIPGPVYDVCDAIDRFREAETSDREARLAAWEPVQKAIEHSTGERIRADGYLADLQIMHAGAFSLSIDMRADDLEFQPVLFGRRDKASDDAADEEEADQEAVGGAGIDELLDEGEALLPPDAQEIFTNHRFGTDTACRQVYPLKRNQFVVLEEPLRRALDVVKSKQQASQSEKQAFVRNPRAAIAEALDLDPEAPETAGLFVETEQYAERVKGIQLWEPKVLPWLPKAGNSWLPEKLGLRINDQRLEIAPEDVPELRGQYEAAARAEQDSFTFNDTEVPVSPETKSSIDYISTVADQMLESQSEEDGGQEESSEDATEDEDEAKSQRYALETEDNIEELGYSLGLTPRPLHRSTEPPSDLVDAGKLHPHQREGFDWLVESWRLGRPGVLLADDMGLGKTLQALTFAAWLHDNLDSAPAGHNAPLLIVAPTALLQTWRAEHDKHLNNGGLGPPLEVYGAGIKKLRKTEANKRDVDAGAAGLDRDALRQASWILTTYETLANYHFSFAAIPYSFVIFDEIQKIKTPNTINTHAAKTLNAHFALGLTGTPVENRLTDLWSIMDRLHPGLLGDLQSFTQTYDAEDEASLRALHQKLTDGKDAPAPMLRRMKDSVDLGTALPPKQTRELPAEMPKPQAEAYEAVIKEARSASGNKRQMLELLHAMRGISLHPRDPEAYVGIPSEYPALIQESARLDECIRVLDDVRARGEKALVYIETRAMQALMQAIIADRYGWSEEPPVINGQTPSAKRQQIADRFQEEAPGFSLLILAPRAAGVGLTLHAANHVIHLSRWWNPAVEDQCNDRAYRIGQTKPVTIYCPMARHPAFGEQTFDVKLNALLNRKRALSRELLIPSETEGDYETLFSEATEKTGDYEAEESKDELGQRLCDQGERSS
jgi:hypothetical protein